jgi:undecaprenyl diphosphate synthase
MLPATRSARCTPSHVAIIMDGNGRWAEARGLARAAGHVAGARAVRRVVTAARAAGIPALTLYAFSADNWSRSRAEVDALMRLFARALRSEAGRCVAHDIRLSVIGRRDRLDPSLSATIDAAERATRQGTAMTLRVAIDYSARDAILHAATLPDVDLLIRTGGERRLSDFLLWECAYAELLFTACAWPDFGAAELNEALADYARRDRRFGAVRQRDARSA